MSGSTLRRLIGMGDGSPHMRRAIELAEPGRYRVMPNPMVGCVLVRDGKIVAEGWHDHIGGLHAEQMAIADADEVMPPKSTWFEPKLKSGLVVHMLD